MDIVSPEIQGLVTTILYLTGLGIVLSLIYGIVEWFSVDRVLKIFENELAFVFIGKEAYYGRIKIPPRSGGGFEVFFPPERMENPKTLLAFLLENYKETGDKKFLKKAEDILAELKERGILEENFTLDDVRIDPWARPSLVSRKIYSGELKDLYGILIFKFALSKSELEKRWRELKKVYSPSFVHIIARRIYNGLAYVKDKISASLTQTTGTFLSFATPEIQKSIQEMESKLVSQVGAIYDPLLENSIGRLVTLEMKDVDGEVKLYQGVLREYSNNYIAVYDVDYRIQMVAKYKGDKILSGYPKCILTIYGWRIDVDQHLFIENLSCDANNVSFVLRNGSDEPVKVETVKILDKEIKIGKVLFPNDGVEVKAGFDRLVSTPDITVDYEISREADMIIPRSKVKIIGSGDYPLTLMRDILKIKR